MILTNGYGGGGSCDGDTKAPVLIACKNALFGDDIPTAYATIYNNGDADFNGTVIASKLVSNDVFGYNREVFPDLWAFGHFDGTDSSPSVTGNSRNVQSITKEATGVYKVKLASATMYNDLNVTVSGNRDGTYGTSFSVDLISDDEFRITCFTTNMSSKVDYKLVTFLVHTV
jgi:hypothetical protein